MNKQSRREIGELENICEEIIQKSFLDGKHKGEKKD